MAGICGMMDFRGIELGGISILAASAVEVAMDVNWRLGFATTKRLPAFCSPVKKSAARVKGD
jgi:hypothetical protein